MLDFLAFLDVGNVYDALFMVARAALWDTRARVEDQSQYP